ncbi:MAG: hypothetical protein Q7Q71_05830 [Verrucomicrobiota bacterium JB023]|nr:hypothetical protein [Verrucomicrobiota bacterium JB023]
MRAVDVGETRNASSVIFWSRSYRRQATVFLIGSALVGGLFVLAAEQLFEGKSEGNAFSYFMVGLSILFGCLAVPVMIRPHLSVRADLEKIEIRSPSWVYGRSLSVPTHLVSGVVYTQGLENERIAVLKLRDGTDFILPAVSGFPTVELRSLIMQVNK